MSTRLVAIHAMTTGLLMTAWPVALLSITPISLIVVMTSSGRMYVASLMDLTVMLSFLGSLTTYRAMEADQKWIYARRPSSERARLCQQGFVSFNKLVLRFSGPPSLPSNLLSS